MADQRAEDEPGVDVDEIGVAGVNLVKSPLELDDNEVVLAQNAEPYRDRGVAGVRKRPAWRQLNVTSKSGALGSVGIDLAASGNGDDLSGADGGSTYGAIYVWLDGATTWKLTVNGGQSWDDTPVDGDEDGAPPTIETNPSASGPLVGYDTYMPIGIAGSWADGTVVGTANAGDALNDAEAPVSTYVKMFSNIGDAESVGTSAGTLSHLFHAPGASHGTVTSVAVLYFMWEEDTGNPASGITVQPFIHHEGTDYDFSSPATLDVWDRATVVSHSFESDTMTTDPVTGDPWDLADILNYEWGVRIDDDAGTAGFAELTLNAIQIKVYWDQ